MDARRGIFFLCGTVLLLGLIGLAGFALFRNMVPDAFFTTFQPKTYDGREELPVRQFKHNGDVLEILQRPETVKQPDRTTKLVRHLVVKFNGKALDEEALPILPARLAEMTVHDLKVNAEQQIAQPTFTTSPEPGLGVGGVTTVEPGVSGEEVARKELEELKKLGDQQQLEEVISRAMQMPASAGVRMEGQRYLYAHPASFTEDEFQRLTATWEANRPAIEVCLRKSVFEPEGGDGGRPVLFATQEIAGLVHGVKPVPDKYRSELPGRYYEGSSEILTVYPDGNWEITCLAGPVAAPLESGNVQVREGMPFLWVLQRPAQTLGLSGLELATHLTSFSGEGSSQPITATYKIDPDKLVQPSPEEELRQQANAMGIEVPMMPGGVDFGGIDPRDIPEGNPQSSATGGQGQQGGQQGSGNQMRQDPFGLQNMQGFDPTNPEFSGENTTGLPPESMMRQRTEDEVVPVLPY